MRIEPIAHTDVVRPRPPRRALMSVRNWGDGGDGKETEHTVIDTATGERTMLPPTEAWALYRKLNLEV